MTTVVGDMTRSTVDLSAARVFFSCTLAASHNIDDDGVVRPKDSMFA